MNTNPGLLKFFTILIFSCVFCHSSVLLSEESPGSEVVENEFIREANLLFDEKDYSAALALYRAVEDSDFSPETHYRIAFCHEKLKHTSEAIKAYQTFLAMKPDKFEQEALDSLEELSEKLKSEYSLLHIITQPPGITVTIKGTNDEVTGVTPFEVNLATPTVMLMYIWGDTVIKRKEVVSTPGNKVIVNVNLEQEVALAETQNTNTLDRPTDLNTIGWTSILCGSVAIIAGGIFGGLYGAKSSEIGDYDPHSPGHSTSGLNTLKSERDGYAAALIGTGSAGVVLLTVGILIIVLNEPDELPVVSSYQQDNFSLGIHPTTDGASLLFTLSW